MTLFSIKKSTWNYRGVSFTADPFYSAGPQGYRRIDMIVRFWPVPGIRAIQLLDTH